MSLLLLQTSRSGGTGCGQQSDLRSASLWPGSAVCAGELPGMVILPCCQRLSCWSCCICMKSEPAAIHSGVYTPVIKRTEQ